MYHLSFLKSLLAGLIFLAVSLPLSAQIESPVQVDVFPPAPTAASLGQFGNTPVGLYVGRPQINVPLWELKEGNIKVPVSLSYNSGGIQVAQAASWVGLGFSLHAGGAVTRTVRGLPDDVTNGFMDPDHPLPSEYNGSAYQQFNYYANGTWDSQPDLFNFNFGDRSGQFQLDQQGNIYMAPFQKINIVMSRPHGYIDGWTITTEDGFQYNFTTVENTKNSSTCINSSGSSSSGDVNYHGSAWYLTSITSPAGAIVNFEYETGFSYTYKTGRFENVSILIQQGSGYFGTSPDIKCETSQYVQGVRLKRIVCTSGSIEFIAGSNRADLPGDKYLDEIAVKNDAGTVIRRFQFGYQYMLGESVISTELTGTPVNPEDYRLVLSTLLETDAGSQAAKAPYRFSYNTGLPNRITTNAIDFWGYYNGETLNTMLAPDEKIKISVDSGLTYKDFYFPGASRVPVEGQAVKGTLNKITYPTGGSTSFTFELHRANAGVSDFITKSAQMISRNVPASPTDPTPHTLPQVTFTVNSAGGNPGAPAIIDASGVLAVNGQNNCNVSVNIYKQKADGTLGDQVYGSDPNKDAVSYLWLDNGTYVIDCPTFTACYPFVFNVRWRELTGNDIFTVGGLRLKRMEDFDPVSNKKVVKTYSYTDAQGKTSGRVLNLPVFGYVYGQSNFSYLGQYFVRTSTSSQPMGFTQGSMVGYGEVTVFHGESSTGEQGISGKTTYKYTNPESNPDVNVVTGFPFSPPDTREWERGALLEQTDYSRQGEANILVRKLQNEYRFYSDGNVSSNVRTCKGVKAAYVQKIPSGFNQIEAHFYYFNTGYRELAKTTEYLYDQDDASKFSTKVTNYTWSPTHLQLTHTEKILSDGRRLTQYVAYPPDYSDNNGFIQDLKAANIINVPIEQVTYKSESDGSNLRIVAGNIITYKAGGKGLKDAVYVLETADPISLGNFRFSNRGVKNVLPPAGVSAPLYIDPSIYKKRGSFDVYDSKGNVLQYSKDDFITSIIWGYNSNLPVAKIENASRGADITVSSQVAYNGFEQGTAPGAEGWQNVNTANIVNRSTDPSKVFAGQYSYKLNAGTTNGPTFDLTPPSPQKGKYRVSFRMKTPAGYTANKAYVSMFTFRKGSCCTAFPANAANNKTLNIPATNNEWQYFESVLDFETLRNSSGSYDLTIRVLVANTDASIPVYIDEIRIAPADAMMITYTYDSQVGETSETLPNGTVNFYEYDTLGRLKTVRNQDGDIVNAYSYIYGNQ